MSFPHSQIHEGCQVPSPNPPAVWFHGHRPPKALVFISVGEYLAPQAPFPARQKAEGTGLRDAAYSWDYTCGKTAASPPPRGPAALPQGCGNTPGCGSDANTNFLSWEEAIFGNRQGLRYLPVARRGTATLCRSPRSRGQDHGDHGWSWWLSPPLWGGHFCLQMNF